ncbi:unnamed protein product [Larinioides sclopetarius]|uniref:Aminotransferase class I/classII large domain-containing protein n=1 Tax=Larinioides sclopetarius TaxID=280406 RepID=A0AAV1ZWJ1_9ARAC
MNICNNDEYDELNNPNGYINLGTGINNICRDIIIPRLTSAHVWDCNLDLLQYREGYGILKLRKALSTIMTEFLDTYEPVDPEDDFGIAGLRIGAIHTRCKPLKNCLKQLSFFHDIPFPVMDIAAKFVGDSDWLKMYLSIYRQRISEKFKESFDFCKRMGLNVRNSSGGFFLWLDLRPICGSSSFVQERDFFFYLIEKAHLYIVPGEELFCAQPGWFRLTFTANPDHVNAGLKRLEEAIKNYTLKV